MLTLDIGSLKYQTYTTSRCIKILENKSLYFINCLPMIILKCERRTIFAPPPGFVEERLPKYEKQENIV